MSQAGVKTPNTIDNQKRASFQVLPSEEDEADSDDPLEILFAFHRYVTSHVIQVNYRMGTRPKRIHSNPIVILPNGT